MKSFLSRLLPCLLFLLFLFPSALAASPNGDVSLEVYLQPEKQYISTQASVVLLELDGTPLPSDVPAVVWQSRTMVPIRLISEHLNASVSWIRETNQVIIRHGSNTIVLTLGSSTAMVNGQALPLPDGVPATIMRYQDINRTMVPLRFVSEQLGGVVDWDQALYTASIQSTPPKNGILTHILTDTDAQTILLSANITPSYEVQDLGTRVAVDFPGMELAPDFPASVPIDNELISQIRYSQHDSSFYPAHSSSVRVVFDLKAGSTLEKNVKVHPVEKGVVVSTFLPDREEIEYIPEVPLDPPKKTVVIDAGHGGSAPGAIYEEIPEKDINLAVAKKLEILLRDKNFNVVMIRTDDTSVGLYQRADIANAIHADLFVSLHSNASSNSNAYGIYTYHHPSSQVSTHLASIIQSAVIQSTDAKDRGIMSANFVVLRETKMPAVLVEMGFMTNHEELMRLIDSSYQDRLADGLANGIVRYFGGK